MFESCARAGRRKSQVRCQQLWLPLLYGDNGRRQCRRRYRLSRMGRHIELDGLFPFSIYQVLKHKVDLRLLRGASDVAPPSHWPARICIDHRTGRSRDALLLPYCRLQPSLYRAAAEHHPNPRTTPQNRHNTVSVRPGIRSNMLVSNSAELSPEYSRLPVSSSMATPKSPTFSFCACSFHLRTFFPSFFPCLPCMLPLLSASRAQFTVV